MTYIKKLVMHGFKSFANKTEIVFDKGINVIVGPNGSGKSNISDGLCFVLGRLSIKSMRAAKAKNLIFMGSKSVKPAKDASVEIVFDNSNKTFAIDAPEISIKRIARHNGQSIYKLNGETKTRTEIVEALAQAGIDPYGFNLVLQGQIQAIVKMHPEERRKIIEEVAGISIYESRKEKSLKELEKTEEKLKEIGTVLRERHAFLRNLERDREQAMRFKELELTVKRCKASLLERKKSEKEKELESIAKSINDKQEQKGKIKDKIQKLEQEIEKISQEVTDINRYIQKAGGMEKEVINEQISNLKAELEGLRVRKESYENRRLEIERRIQEINSSIPEYEREILDLREKSPLMAKKQEELQKKKQELAKLEEEKKRIYTMKTEFQAIKDRLRDKENQSARLSAESDSLLKQIEEQASKLQHQDSQACQKAIESLKKDISELKKNLNDLNALELAKTKIISVAENNIHNAQEVRNKVNQIDVCPLCQNKMTPAHLEHVNNDSESKIIDATRMKEEAQTSLDKIKEDRDETSKKLSEQEKKLDSLERQLSIHHIISDKQTYLKRLIDQEKNVKKEIIELEEKRDMLEKKTIDSSRIEEQYTSKIHEIEEISSRTEDNLDKTLEFKQRDLEKLKELIKINKKDISELQLNIKEITESIDNKSSALEDKENEEIRLNEKFDKMFKKRDSLQDDSQKKNYDLSTYHSEVRQIEEQINYLKVGDARIRAEKEAVEMELVEFSGIELIKAPVQALEERLQKSQQALYSIGSINLRALEVYEEVKTEYDKVQEKVDTLTREKDEILKIIAEIDNKKKKTFMKTFKAISELFSENFARLYTKGVAFLELENQEDIFAGGVNIVIRLAKGKYFDVTSLSGGEQTLVAMSLLFAIQEFKPYHFYVFDEIDAALDKRNSERLAALLKKYMKAGQYVIVTHNDALILESNVLYGVSMHDGVSKVLSLKVTDN